jgi:alpha-tubulin suppressor-like RCC1 family protein
LYIDGSINACGKNDYGQLGDGSNIEKILTEVLLDEVVRSIYTGPSSESVFFVTEDDTVYGTGDNSYGQLGVGDRENRAIPTRVKFEEQVLTNGLSPSEDHTIAFGLVTGSLPPSASPTPAPTFPITSSPTRENLNFFFWGAPESLGQRSSEDVTKPLYVDENSVQASAGSRYTLIVLQDGAVLSGGFIESKDSYHGWLGLGGIVVTGENDFKQISNVYDLDNAIADAPEFDQVFAGVESIPGSGIIHTVLLDRQGNAYTTGSNNKGQLCLGDEDERLIPSQIPIEGRILDVAVGGEHTLLLHENGTVYVCGSNDVGQIGLGDVSQTSFPMILDSLSPVSSVSAGMDHSLFIAEDGIYVTGDNSFGQLCIDTDGESIYVPNMLDNPTEKVSAFEAIRSSTFVLHTDGVVEACGKNDFGQLGDGTNETVVVSTEVLLDDVVRLLGTGPSAESVFFVTEDELVYGSGFNSRGNLGIGNTQNQNVPVTVKFPNEVMLSSLSAAGDHTVALGLITGTIIPTAAPTIGSTTVTPTSTPTLSPSRRKQ